MAIKPNETITYGDLVENFKNWIQNKANLINVANDDNEYNRKVPEEWRSGYVKNLSVSRTNAQEPGPIQNVGASLKIRESSVIGRVSIDTVMSQFNQFMSSRGLSTKTDTQISTRGVINFWNNVAAFCSTNIVLVSSNEKTTPQKMYKSNTSWPSVPNIGDSELITASDVTTMLSSIEDIVNKTTKLHQIIYDISAVSSSSSSSCCCSCSSSSSVYIVYMNI